MFQIQPALPETFQVPAIAFQRAGTCRVCPAAHWWGTLGKHDLEQMFSVMKLHQILARLSPT